MMGPVTLARGSRESGWLSRTTICTLEDLARSGPAQKELVSVNRRMRTCMYMLHVSHVHVHVIHLNALWLLSELGFLFGYFKLKLIVSMAREWLWFVYYQSG